jgi:phosphoglycerol transferase MdoB-like AlkP superfamily enzyme
MIRKLFHSKYLALLVLLFTSLIELAIADRKYGVFTGGFGQSRAVDTPGEVALFVMGYAIAQCTLAMLVWQLCAFANRKSAGWPVIFNFCVLFGSGFLAALSAQYQLHSYFSDTVSFTLLKQLGGGSLTDALLFGLNEIASAGGLLLIALALWWGAWKLCVRYWGKTPATNKHTPGGKAFLAALLVFVSVAFAIPRTGSDAAFGLNRTLAWGGGSSFLNWASDVDQDGYGLFSTDFDTHPFDVARHPLALDIPGNGVDEDGYGGDLKLVPVPQPRGETSVPANGPNVVMVVMESTRGDVLGKRIDGKLVAPNLMSLMAQGSGIAPSYSHVAFTTASLKSIFTGRLAPQKGDASLFTELKSSGYRVAVFSGQPEDFGDISATVRMRENADIFVDAEKLRDKRAFSFAAQGSLLVDEGVLLDEFRRTYAGKQAWAKPSFFYFNFQTPHFPYDHPGVAHRVTTPVKREQISVENKEKVQRTYWNAVAQADARLGELIAQLKADGVWDNTILLVTGDHGESLFEDGFLGHGHIINRAQYSTFLVSNRPITNVRAPIAISQYRDILLDMLTGQHRERPAFAPFMHIGDLDAPTQIGMALAESGSKEQPIVSLRLDTGEACFSAMQSCLNYDALKGAERTAVDALIARWGSERWAVQPDSVRSLAK